MIYYLFCIRMIVYVITANVVNSTTKKMATDTISSTYMVNLRFASSISVSESVGDIASHNVSPSSSRTIEQYGSSRYVLLLMFRCGSVNTHCWVRLRISSAVLLLVINNWLWKMTSFLSTLQNNWPSTRNLGLYWHWHSWFTALATAFDMSDIFPVEFAACSQNSTRMWWRKFNGNAISMYLWVLKLTANSEQCTWSERGNLIWNGTLLVTADKACENNH